MKEFTTTRRPIKDWCGPVFADSFLFEGKPITIDLDSVCESACGVRQWNVVRDGFGPAVCEHVIYIGD